MTGSIPATQQAVYASPGALPIGADRFA